MMENIKQNNFSGWFTFINLKATGSDVLVAYFIWNVKYLYWKYKQYSYQKQDVTSGNEAGGDSLPAVDDCPLVRGVGAEVAGAAAAVTVEASARDPLLGPRYHLFALQLSVSAQWRKCGILYPINLMSHLPSQVLNIIHFQGKVRCQDKWSPFVLLFRPTHSLAVPVRVYSCGIVHWICWLSSARHVIFLYICLALDMWTFCVQV